MFDSIDFGIENINITDFKYNLLLNLKVEQKVNNIIFEYETVQFRYYFSSRFLSIHTIAHKVLNKMYITLNDKLQYINKVMNILGQIIVNLKEHELKLMRIDYHIDLKLYDKVNDYIEILNKNVSIYKYMKKKISYNTSIYLSTKSGKQNINIYNKYEESHKEIYNGILRVEVQCKKRLVKGELKKYGITRELDNYWNENAMENYFFDIINGFCYKGDYYKRKIANKIIDESNYTNYSKTKLKEFLLDLENKGFEGIKKMKKYNHCKINNRIEKLTALNINPITIPVNFNYDKLENLPELIRNTAKENCFL